MCELNVVVVLAVGLKKTLLDVAVNPPLVSWEFKSFKNVLVNILIWNVLLQLH
jgi:hypothetical protein